MRMVVLHPDGAATLLKHVNDENGTSDVFIQYWNKFCHGSSGSME